MSKRVLLGVAIIAVVAVGYFAVKGWPPSEEGAEGTIQAAKRYRSDQIQSADVILQDADVQALLQTDFFHRLITDKNFAKVINEEAFQNIAMANDEVLAMFNHALEREEFVQALAMKDIESATAVLAKLDLDGGEQIKEAASYLQAAIEQAEFREAIGQNDLAAAERMLHEIMDAKYEIEQAGFMTSMVAALEQHEVVAALAKNDIQEVESALNKLDLGEAERADLLSYMTAALEQAEFNQAIAAHDLAAASATFENLHEIAAELRQAEFDSYLASALAQVEFRTAVAQIDVAAAVAAFENSWQAQHDLASAELNHLLNSRDMLDLLNEHGSHALNVLGMPELVIAAQHAGFDKLMSVEAFQKAVEIGEAQSFLEASR